MPASIVRDEVQRLLEQGAQLLEVLSHLPRCGSRGGDEKRPYHVPAQRAGQGDG